MKKQILHTCCPYCKDTNLETIGVQHTKKFEYELANCTNTKCKPYTITISKLAKDENCITEGATYDKTGAVQKN